MERLTTWTRPALVRLSSSGSAEVGSYPFLYEGKKIAKTVGTGYIYGSFVPPS
jgi:hypothetical protein